MRPRYLTRWPYLTEVLKGIYLYVNLYTKFEFSILNGRGDILEEKSGEKEKKNKYKEEQIGECPFAIPQYNLSLRTYIPNLKFLS